MTSSRRVMASMLGRGPRLISPGASAGVQKVNVWHLTDRAAASNGLRPVLKIGEK